MKPCEIKHLEVRYAHVKASCAILISSPLAYAFYIFLKYTATYSSFLKTCSPFSVETGPALAGNQLLGLGTYFVQDFCLFSHSLEGVWKNESGRCWKGKGSFLDTLPRSRFYSRLHHRGSCAML